MVIGSAINPIIEIERYHSKKSIIWKVIQSSSYDLV
jgi:hypothetical protein